MSESALLDLSAKDVSEASWEDLVRSMTGQTGDASRQRGGGCGGGVGFSGSCSSCSSCSSGGGGSCC